MNTKQEDKSLEEFLDWHEDFWNKVTKDQVKTLTQAEAAQLLAKMENKS